MSSERYGDTDLVYWMGRSINAMTREELQIALGEAMMQNERLKGKIWDYMRRQHNEQTINSRFTNPEYIASFC